MPDRPKTCAVVVSTDFEVSKEILPLIDLFEVRIDLIGEGWQKVAKQLSLPWLATNRSPVEGGKGETDEEARVAKLFEAVELGASMVDVELSLKSLKKVVPKIKKKATCLVSFHDINGTPPLPNLVEIAQRQIDAGADICKIVTTASSFDDNLTMLRLLRTFPKKKMVALAMGPHGMASRILSPMAGAYFTYASLTRGKESAPGQLTVSELREIWRTVGVEK